MNNLEKTFFMNKTTFNEGEIKNYPYNERKTYLIDFVEVDRDELTEPVQVYATDDVSLIAYLETVFIPESILSIQEVITTYREVTF